MTGFEMFMFGSVALMFAAMFVFGIVCLVRRDDIKAIKNNRIDNLYDSSMGNIHGQESSERSIQTTRCYENGEITNLCTIIALKNVKREMQNMLSSIEKDALDKAVDNIIKIEKINAFVESNNNEK